MYFALESTSALSAALDKVQGLEDGKSAVIGFGELQVKSLGCHIDGLRAFPVLSGDDVDSPSTQHALWCRLRGDHRGELLIRSSMIEAALSRPASGANERNFPPHDGPRPDRLRRRHLEPSRRSRSGCGAEDAGRSGGRE